MFFAGCRQVVLLLAVTVVFQGYCLAGSEEEIIHLLNFVEKSQCTFNRNGKVHDSAKARQHIESKYNHVRSRVSSTEKFIQYAATRSSISGKPYTVQCRDKILLSADWLHEELERYRSK